MGLRTKLHNFSSKDGPADEPWMASLDKEYQSHVVGTAYQRAYEERTTSLKGVL